MKLPRRQFMHLAVGAAALPAVARTARAQAYPTRPVRIIAGFAPGGVIDIAARLMGQFLSERMGQPFVIENRPGAAGNIGTEAVVRGPADGYTLLMAGTVNTINATLYENLNFNFIRDIAPVASVIRFANVMEVSSTFQAKTVPEFTAYAKANPSKVNMASGGNGTAQHLSGELFKMMTGINMLHVPYRGAAPALTDLLAGQVQVMFDAMPSSIEQIRSGKLRAGGDHGDASGGAAGRSDRKRVCAGLRDKRLEWHLRAKRYARRDHRKTQPGDQCKPLRSQASGAHFWPRWNGTCRFNHRFRQAHCRRHREMGQGSEVLGR